MSGGWTVRVLDHRSFRASRGELMAERRVAQVVVGRRLSCRTQPANLIAGTHGMLTYHAADDGEAPRRPGCTPAARGGAAGDDNL